MSRLFGKIGLGLFVCLLGASAASAGVSIVSDGADGDTARIRIEHAIRKGDLAAFQDAIARVSRTATAEVGGVPFVTVELDSPGGDVVEALGIGRAIYAHSAMTIVRPGHECVSACVFILVAGSVRTPEAGAEIGVHKPLLVSWRHMDYSQAHAKYDALMQYLRTYFTELGVSDSAWDIMMRTGSYDMRYFSAAELDALRVRGENPQWLKRSVPGVAAPIRADMIAAMPLARPRKLPQPDPAWREIVYMPGDMPVQDYLASQNITLPRFVWTTLDDGQDMMRGAAPDIDGWLKGLYGAAEPMLAGYWWLIALVLLEIVRGRLVPWPANPSPEDSLRLGPLRQ